MVKIMNQNELFSLDIDKLSESQVDGWLNWNISRIPNNGKLYRYRSLNNFDLEIEAIKDKYLWLSSPSSFNDRKDATIFIDRGEEEKRLTRWFENNKLPILKYILKSMVSDADKKNVDSIPDETLKDFINAYERSPEALKELAYSHGVDEDDFSRCSLLLNQTLPLLENNSKPTKDAIQSLLNFNETYRNRLHIVCFSDSCDNNPMWAYYSNSNKGYCVEYDIKRVLKMDLATKKKFLCLYQVNYSNKHRDISLIPMMTQIFGNAGIPNGGQETTQGIMSGLTTKEKQWEHENEWRLILVDVDNKFPVDLVSTIYFDESIEKGNELKELQELPDIRFVRRRFYQTNNTYLFELVN